VLDASGCAVIPGLVQSHVHLCQALFRGMADDLPLLSWLRERIWPLEAAHDARSLAASARLGLAEMLLGGTTCILDMGTVHEHEAVFSAMRESGIRGYSGKAMMDRGRGLPGRLRESARSSLEQSEQLCARWHGIDDGRIRYAFAPRFVLSCSNKLLRGAAEAAETHDTLVHTHAAEHADERKAVRDKLGTDDVAALESHGIAGPRAVLAHGVQLRRAEIRRMARLGTRLVHCPSANLKLASGIAPVRQMHDAGLAVGIGSDGAPCNNRMDAWTEMRTAALLAKHRQKDAAALPPEDVLAMATLDGARVLGLQDEIGSLEVGKRADVTVVRLDDLHAMPGGDPVSRLIYACTASDVRHVLVDGRKLVERGELRSLDSERVRSQARKQARRVQSRVE
jgi:cytosine/adenosine deaminase-related metal-dependent hydrolase